MLISRSFLESGRQDLNLRPPGPQPGALPDCATPRGTAKRATGIEPALKAWKASVQPQHFARKPDLMLLPRGTLPRGAPSDNQCRLARPASQTGLDPRRSSVGTSPVSPVSPGGGHGPNQLSRAPSSVIVDPFSAFPSGEHSSATSHACSRGSPNRCIGTERAMPARTVSGTCPSPPCRNDPLRSPSPRSFDPPSARPFRVSSASTAPWPRPSGPCPASHDGGTASR